MGQDAFNGGGQFLDGSGLFHGTLGKGLCAGCHLGASGGYLVRGQLDLS